MILNPPADSPLMTAVPCIASLSMPNASPRLYGPFINVETAMKWVDAVNVQFPYMQFMIQPLRRPERDRYSSEHWFGREENDLEGFIDDLMDIQEWRDAIGKNIKK